MVNPVITQDVAGSTTVQVLGGLKAAPALVNAVTSIDTVGPVVVPDAATGVGVTVTSVLPGATATVGTPGATKFHCG